MSQLDLRNPRRVIRAIEVCLLTGRPFSSFRTEWAQAEVAGCGIVLQRDRAELHQRVAERTAAMFAAGVEEEVGAISEIGPTAEQAIGFREIRELRAGRRTREECLRAIEEATRQYAKRQMTWFRRETALEPIEVSPQTEATTIGAAYLAGLAVGVWGSFDEIAAAWKPQTVVDPGDRLDREQWARAVDRARGWIPDLSALDF